MKISKELKAKLVLCLVKISNGDLPPEKTWIEYICDMIEKESNDKIIQNQNTRNLLHMLSTEFVLDIPDDPRDETEFIREMENLIRPYMRQDALASPKVIDCSTCAKQKENLPECLIVKDTEHVNYCLLGWEPKE